MFVRLTHVVVAALLMVSAAIAETSGLSSLHQCRSAGGATGRAALLLSHTCPVCSLVAPCQPGAALHGPSLMQRGQATSNDPFAAPIPAVDGLIMVDVVEFASLPDVDGAGGPHDAPRR